MKRPQQKRTNAQKKKAKVKRSQKESIHKNERKGFMQSIAGLMGLL